jgi:hypothetical protein
MREFDRLLAMGALQNTPGVPTRIKMIKNGMIMQPDAFSKTKQTVNGQIKEIDCVSISRLIRMGGTIVAQAVDDVAPGLFELCGGLEGELSHHVQANVYLTPPHSQGHKAHYDSHDVIILQISGGKHWKVFDRRPDVGEKSELCTIDPGERPVIDTLLTPGDTLYIPLGWPHVADSVDDVSLHITVGIAQASLYDLLKYALGNPAIRPYLDKPLAAGFSKTPLALSPALVDGHHFLAQALSDSDTAREVIEGFTRLWCESERRDRAGLIVDTIEKLREQ